MPEPTVTPKAAPVTTRRKNSSVIRIESVRAVKRASSARILKGEHVAHGPSLSSVARGG